MCKLRHKLRNAQKGIGQTFTWSNESCCNDMMVKRLLHRYMAAPYRKTHGRLAWCAIREEMDAFKRTQQKWQTFQSLTLFFTASLQQYVIRISKTILQKKLNMFQMNLQKHYHVFKLIVSYYLHLNQSKRIVSKKIEN